MKIGILNSDTVQIDGAKDFGQYPEMFSKIFWAVDPSIQFQTYEVQLNNYPLDIDECDAYLITGSKASSYDDEQWIHDLKKFIQRLNKNKKKINWNMFWSSNYCRSSWWISEKISKWLACRR
jgi:GMP synthase-like glutamine amidotransferase